jgi:hypothetical protein
MKLCAVSGCNNKHVADGLCQTHYNKQYRANNREFIRELSTK